jgi:hypothetical protein
VNLYKKRKETATYKMRNNTKNTEYTKQKTNIQNKKTNKKEYLKKLSIFLLYIYQSKTHPVAVVQYTFTHK